MDSSWEPESMEGVGLEPTKACAVRNYGRLRHEILSLARLTKLRNPSGIGFQKLG